MNQSEIYKAPKVDMHVHLEGSVCVEVLSRLATKNKISLNSKPLFNHPKAEENSDALNFLENSDSIELWVKSGVINSFQDFIRIYLKASEAIVSGEDLIEVIRSYAESARRQNVVYSEMYFTPTTFELFGRNLEEFFSALAEGEKIALRDYDTKISWIFDIVRNGFSPPEKTLDHILRANKLGANVDAIALAGYETEGDIYPYIDVFNKARSYGLKTLAHAGETTSYKNIELTLELLKPDRIGHALSLVNSSSLTERIAELQIPIEVCPWSNICLNLSSFESHPVVQMINSGVNVVICSDDPGILGKDLLENYLLLNQRGVHFDSILRLIEKSRCLCFDNNIHVNQV